MLLLDYKIANVCHNWGNIILISYNMIYNIYSSLNYISLLFHKLSNFFFLFKNRLLCKKEKIHTLQHNSNFFHVYSANEGALTKAKFVIQNFFFTKWLKCKFSFENIKDLKKNYFMRFPYFEWDQGKIYHSFFFMNLKIDRVRKNSIFIFFLSSEKKYWERPFYNRKNRITKTFVLRKEMRPFYDRLTFS